MVYRENYWAGGKQLYPTQIIIDISLLLKPTSSFPVDFNNLNTGVMSGVTHPGDVWRPVPTGWCYLSRTSKVSLADVTCTDLTSCVLPLTQAIWPLNPL